MSGNDDVARSILDDVAYMVLATADVDGVPWASPVWFATERYVELHWMSDPDAQHSRNIAVRPDVGIVVFDSTAPPAARQAVYMRATAQLVDEPDAFVRGVDAFSRCSLAQGLGPLSVDEVTGPSRFRLYRADVSEHWILQPDHDVRVRVHP
jgi:hypothetical protein